MHLSHFGCRGRFSYVSANVWRHHVIVGNAYIFIREDVNAWCNILSENIFGYAHHNDTKINILISVIMVLVLILSTETYLLLLISTYFLSHLASYTLLSLTIILPLSLSYSPLFNSSPVGQWVEQKWRAPACCSGAWRGGEGGIAAFQERCQCRKAGQRGQISVSILTMIWKKNKDFNKNLATRELDTMWDKRTP